MPMQPAEIEALIKAALPDAEVTIEDLAGDGDHYAATRRLRSPSAARAASSSTRSSTPPCKGAWAASCTPSPSRPQPLRKGSIPMTNPAFERIEADVKSNPVVLFMKGTPVFPQCGFSARVVQVLSHVGVPFKGVNVLEDMEIREGIKAYANWPTIPQLYVKRRVRRRLRHRPRDVPVRRAAIPAQGEGHPRLRGRLIPGRPPAGAEMPQAPAAAHLRPRVSRRPARLPWHPDAAMSDAQNPAPAISIITPAYDVARFVGTTVDSVLAQTVASWEMVVVDDGSEDGTAAVVARRRDPRIRLLRQKNAGVSAARTRAIAAARGRAILFLDADDWLAPDALSRLSAALHAAPDAVGAYGAFAFVAEEAEPGDPPLRRKTGPFPAGDILERLLVQNLFANGGHLLLRREAVDRAGPFHAHIRYGEDWEYWIRLAIQGPFAVVPGAEPLLFVRQRTGSAFNRMARDPSAFAPGDAGHLRQPRPGAAPGQCRARRSAPPPLRSRERLDRRPRTHPPRPARPRAWRCCAPRSPPRLPRSGCCCSPRRTPCRCCRNACTAPSRPTPHEPRPSPPPLQAMGRNTGRTRMSDERSSGTGATAPGESNLRPGDEARARLARHRRERLPRVQRQGQARERRRSARTAAAPARSSPASPAAEHGSGRAGGTLRRPPVGRGQRE